MLVSAVLRSAMFWPVANCEKMQGGNRIRDICDELTKGIMYWIGSKWGIRNCIFGSERKNQVILDLNSGSASWVMFSNSSRALLSFTNWPAQSLQLEPIDPWVSGQSARNRKKQTVFEMGRNGWWDETESWVGEAGCRPRDHRDFKGSWGPRWLETSVLGAVTIFQQSSR